MAVGVATTLGLGLAVSGSLAYIASTSGQVIKLSSPPTNVTPNGISDASRVFAFDEQQGVTLASPIKVDWLNPGTYTGTTTGSAFFLPTGTVVDSHYIDSNRAPGGTSGRSATITFAQDILGVIGTRGKLADSDVLGAPGTVYNGAYPSREMEGDDTVTIVNSRTVTINWNTTSVVDQMRVITKHNAPPTANAGGPYSGFEGSNITLNGTASDPEGDSLTYLWSFTRSGDPLGVCSYSLITTLAPKINCTDDSVVTATLSVSDAYHAPVTSVATVTVNNAPPVINTLTLPGGQVPLGATVNLSSSWGDPGSADAHTATINWGDSATSSGTVSEALHTVTGSHVYTTNGTFTVTLTLKDDNGGIDTKTGTVRINGPPTADAHGPYSGDEGSNVALAGTASDPDADSLTTTWVFTPGAADPGTTCTPTNANTLTPSITCNDDVVVGAQLTVNDGVNAPVVSNTTVTFANAAPVLGVPSVTAAPIKTNDPVTINAAFTDAGKNDTHTATIDWGDSSPTAPASVTETPGSGTGTTGGTHQYSLPGAYTITLTVTDDDGGSDSQSATITVNAPPTANAGGPYAGAEGSPSTLNATANDADGDPLTYSWMLSWTGSGSGVVCNITNGNTLTPSITCNDDTVVTATLHVNDGVYPTDTTSVATLTIGNQDPTGGPILLTPNTAIHTSTVVNLSTPFSDPGTHDTHTATIDWGDGSLVATGLVTESNGAGTVTGTHTFTTPGTYTVTVVITDDDGGSVTLTTGTGIVVNDPPVIDAGGPYSTTEGTGAQLNGTASDPENDPLTYSWSFGWINSPAVTCNATNTTTLQPTVTCNDNTIVTATLTVNDPLNSTQDTATVTVANVDPVAGTATVSTNLTATNTPVTASVPFTDAGTHDTHTVQIDWGDGTTAGSVTESNGAGTASGTHSYTAAGMYTVTLQVFDDDGGSDSATVPMLVIVYDPAFGHVTAEVSYNTQSGWYTPDNPNDPDRTGPTGLGMNVQYLNPTDTVPSGTAQVNFNVANLHFRARGFYWLVVDNPGRTYAFFRGFGVVNNTGNYNFLVGVLNNAGRGNDYARVQITDAVTGNVLYDSQPGDPDNATPTTLITGGFNPVRIQP